MNTTVTLDRGDAGLRVAVHEAGHAVVYLLLGYHVADVSFEITNHDNDIDVATGATTPVAINDTALAHLVGIAAGEVAVHYLLKANGHPDAATQAYATAEGDLELAQTVAAETTLPLEIGRTLAASLVMNYWPAIRRVAEALYHSPNRRLEAEEILTAADLGDAEIGWDQLRDMARLAMPDHAGLEYYLTGPGEEDEGDRGRFLSLLWLHGLLDTPPPALRRQIHAEVHHRGLAQLKTQLAAVADVRFEGEL